MPKSVRQALGVGYGGRIVFRLEGGAVTVHALPPADTPDPALAPFLALLEADLATSPASAVLPLTPALAERLDTLASMVGSPDLDAPIEGDVAL